MICGQSSFSSHKLLCEKSNQNEHKQTPLVQMTFEAYTGWVYTLQKIILSV